MEIVNKYIHILGNSAGDTAVLSINYFARTTLDKMSETCSMHQPGLMNVNPGSIKMPLICVLY